jgi:hypothetical protein
MPYVCMYIRLNLDARGHGAESMSTESTAVMSVRLHSKEI